MFRNLIGNLGLLLIYFPFRWITASLSFNNAIVFAKLIAKIHSKFPVPPQPQLLRGIKNIIGSKWSSKQIHNVMLSNLDTRYFHLIELFQKRGFSSDTIDERISSTQGLEHLESVLSLKKGAILVGSHFGSYDVPLFALGLKGYKLFQHVVLSHSYSGKSFKFIDEAILKVKIRYHSAIPVKMLYYNEKSYVRDLVRCVHEEGILLLMGDGSHGSRFTSINFLGKKIRFSTGPAHLAKITGAPILPVFAVRENDMRHKVIIHPPIFVDGTEANSIKEAVLHYALLLEKYVVEYPGHWYTWDRLVTEKDPTGEEVIHLVTRKVPPTHSPIP